jgi:5-methylcytosine-specific restriction protein A
MPNTPCIERGCPRFATSRGRCDPHRKELERERSARRRAATKGIYARKRWETTRRKVFARDGLCECGGCDACTPLYGRPCAKVATDCDHITPLHEDDSHPYALEGLQGLCAPCHWRKTARENAMGVGEGP